jgi:hypothetical protein
MSLEHANEVFAKWLLWVPPGADLKTAAREQIASIDRRGLPHAEVKYLRTLLVAVANGYTGTSNPSSR